MRNLLLSWNIDGQLHRQKTDRLETAQARVKRTLGAIDDMVGSADAAVVALQEVPDDLKSMLTQHTRELRLLEPFSPHVAFAVKGDVEVEDVAFVSVHGDDNDRILAASFSGILQDQLQIINLHLHPWMHENANEQVRASKAALQGLAIRGQWKKGDHFAVVGDFNDQPYHQSITSKLGLWAIRDRRDLESNWESPDQNPPLYNPMWRFLPERDLPPFGSWEYLNQTSSGVRWWLFDQMLCSPSLADIFASVEILTKYAHHTFCDQESGKPKKGVYSDHLPVALWIEEK